jgi:uncharacterized protein (DUF2147 family)
MLCSGFLSLTRIASGAVGALILAAATLLPAANAQTQPQIAPLTGVWIDHTGRGAVEIHTCGNQICGRIAWLKDATDSKGGPAKDKKGRPLCGLQIIGDLKPTSNGVWDGGWIYDPDKDDTFNVEVTLKGKDRLQVMGYMGVKFLSETHMWKRAPEPFTGCNTARAS